MELGWHRPPRKCLSLDGGLAAVNDLVLRDGVIDVDVATSAVRGFFGIQFRLDDDGANGEWVYLRQHKSGLPDAMQYTPILRTGVNWQIYHGPGFTGAVDVPRDAWFHLCLEITGAQARLFVQDMATPALVMDDPKSGGKKRILALHSLNGATCFANFAVRETPPVPWQRYPGSATSRRWRQESSRNGRSRRRSTPSPATSSDRCPPRRASRSRGRRSPRSRRVSSSSIAIATHRTFR